MAYVFFNPNPLHCRVGDCVIRAISKATGQSWGETYAGIVLKGYEFADMPSADHVWGEYLKSKGFCRHVVPDLHGAHYTVETFSREHPEGTYILAISGHVVCVVNGDYYDSWDSGDCVPLYYWTAGNNALKN